MAAGAKEKKEKKREKEERPRGPVQERHVRRFLAHGHACRNEQPRLHG